MKALNSLIEKMITETVILFVLWLTTLAVAHFNKDIPTLFWSIILINALIILANLIRISRIYTNMYLSVCADLDVEPSSAVDIMSLRKKAATYAIISQAISGLAWLAWIWFGVHFLFILPIFLIQVFLDLTSKHFIKQAIWRTAEAK